MDSAWDAVAFTFSKANGGKSLLQINVDVWE